MSVCRRYYQVTVFAAALAVGSGPAPAQEAGLDEAALLELETLLRDLGFDPGQVDGVIDGDTIDAIRRYQDFAVLSGEPEPNERLLNELRGVAAAFAALNAGQEEAPAVPAPEQPDIDEGPAETPAPSRDDDTAVEDDSAVEEVPEKAVVPPPPAPPKLKPLDALPAETAEEAGPDAQTAEAGTEQIAELPPASAAEAVTPVDDPPQVPGSEAIREMLSTEAPAAGEQPDPAAAQQARIEAELAPYRPDLDAGRVNREALAKRFNQEGRDALQRAQYAAAVLKFSVAIHLDPDFAGAYSNRGTAYQRQERADLAAEDFAKARRLGFGGLRIRDGSNPFN
jgi:tetratricopeptide (TPR) repeat protein